MRSYTATVGYKHDQNEMLAAAVDLVLEEGLSKLSFGRLATRLGVADRSVVYYFPSKSELVEQTVAAVAGRLQRLLGDAFGEEPLPPSDLARRAWPVLASSEADPIFALFFELVGLGAARISPFDVLAPTLVESWIDWLVPRVDGGAIDPRSAAYSVVATLDGLLLLRATCGADAARSAAEALGIE